MNRFVSDSEEFRPADDGPTPATASQLVRALAAEGKPLAIQRAAVAEWLRVHDASPMLLASLQRSGLLYQRLRRTPVRILASYVAIAADQLAAGAELRDADEEALAEAWLQLRAERDVLATSGRPYGPSARRAALVAREWSSVELASSILDVLGERGRPAEGETATEIRERRLSMLIDWIERVAAGDQAAASEVREIFMGVTRNLAASVGKATR